MPEPKVLTLAYRRSTGVLSTGAFLLTATEEDPPSVLEQFENIEFIDMMKKLAKYLQDYPQVAAAFQRTDRPGLLPCFLAADEVELFRSDPAAAIRQRMVPPQVVHIRGDKPKSAPSSVIPPLDAGYATLAQCFGEVVYTRVRRTKPEDPELVECTSCGMWCPVARIDAQRWAFRCVECSTWMPIEDFQPDEGWAGVSVQLLLDSGNTRFFFPRRWNQNGNWITRVQLFDLHSAFLQEKNKCKA